VPGTKRDNRSAGPPGNPRGGTLAALLGAGQDPLAWAWPIARFGRMRLLAHWALPLWLAAELIAWLPRDSIGLIHALAASGWLALLAGVREIVRVVVARRLGADVDAVAIWPLGGLSPMSLAGAPRSLLSESGGLVTNLILLPLTAAWVLWAGAGWSALWFDPFAPRVVAGALRSQAQVIAWWAFYANLVMTGVNLLPMACFDGGRALHTLLWARAGAEGSVRTARIGLACAAVVLVLAGAAGHTRIVLIGLFGALATYLEFRRAEFLLHPLPDPRDVTRVHAPARAHEQPMPAPPAPSLDEVLAKISRSGIASLSPAERDVLSQETERRNRG
jgi:Zn-dependent protease